MGMTNAVERPRRFSPQTARPPRFHGGRKRRHHVGARLLILAVSATGDLQVDCRSRGTPSACWPVRSQPARGVETDQPASISSRLRHRRLRRAAAECQKAGCPHRSYCRRDSYWHDRAACHRIGIGSTHPDGHSISENERFLLHVVEADLNTLRTRDLRARNIDFRPSLASWNRSAMTSSPSTKCCSMTPMLWSWAATANGPGGGTCGLSTW